MDLLSFIVIIAYACMPPTRYLPIISYKEEVEIVLILFVRFSLFPSYQTQTQ